LEKIGNPEPLGEQRDCGACDALLFYVNQVGTLSEALEAYRLVRSAGWSITIR
jgi:enolase